MFCLSLSVVGIALFSISTIFVMSTPNDDWVDDLPLDVSSIDGSSNDMSSNPFPTFDQKTSSDSEFEGPILTSSTTVSDITGISVARLHRKISRRDNL